MNPHRYAAVLLSLALASAASAQSPFWKDQNGKPAAETASMKSRDGFGGSILLTSDADWKQKWDTPAESSPNFTVASKVGAGRKVSLLMFFSNAKPDAAGNIKVLCDITLIDPKGAASLIKKDAVCFDGQISGSPHNIYLSRPTIDLSFNPTDAHGTWAFQVNLRDAVRKVSLPLRTSFELK